MKKVVITEFNRAETNVMRDKILAEGEYLQVSDGYHTIDELYDHRITLFIALCRILHSAGHNGVWRSKLHADGDAFEGWFLLGIGKEGDKGKQITYHLPLDRWEETTFADTLERGPEWDGHTPTDVLGRLKLL